MGAGFEMIVEQRDTDLTWPDVDVELRVAPDDEVDGLAGRRFSGYAAVFDTPSEKLATPLGTFVETIKRGAFTRTLADKRNRIRMFVNHNTDLPLASTRSGTLSLVEDERGLRADAVLPDTSAGRDMAYLIRAGIVDSMSFGFSVPKGGDSWNESGDERAISEVRLREVSIVTAWPGYRQTSASVRSLDDWADDDELRDAWQVLRTPEARLTSDQATLLIRLINERSDERVMPARLAHWREVFAARAVR